MAKKTVRLPPGIESDQHHAQCRELAEFDPDVEGQHVGNEPVGRDRQILKLGGQTEAVEETEYEYGRLHVGLKAELTESVQVFERLVDDGKADDSVDEIGIGVDPAQHAQEQCRAVPHRKQRHVGGHVAQPVQEEDHPCKEQQVIVAGDHVLGAKVDERADLRPDVVDEKSLVRTGNAVAVGDADHGAAQQQPDYAI